MSYRKPTIVKEPALGMLLYLFVGLLAITLWKGFAELARHEQSSQQQPLAGALRAGALEFDEYRDRIVIGQPQATVASHANSGIALELIATVRNDTARVIKGLEVRGSVVDHEGRSMSERVAVIIPTQQTAIEPNEEINARLLLEGVSPEATRAGVRMEVTGVVLERTNQGGKR
jgi:hypothetical protein